MIEDDEALGGLEKEETAMSAYVQEWLDSLRTIREKASSCKEIEYFIELAEQYYQPEAMKKRNPRVILLDCSFP